MMEDDKVKHWTLGHLDDKEAIFLKKSKITQKYSLHYSAIDPKIQELRRKILNLPS